MEKKQPGFWSFLKGDLYFFFKTGNVLKIRENMNKSPYSLFIFFISFLIRKGDHPLFLLRFHHQSKFVFDCF
jgi:hypothetical protein